ncbi:hypothetical protein FBY03_12736 [Pseudomonas sp. SJZ079]|nr:hypothetical protein FBY03_12736 [Pseudomonas sp. SJZ079]
MGNRLGEEQLLTNLSADSGVPRRAATRQCGNADAVAEVLRRAI